MKGNHGNHQCTLVNIICGYPRDRPGNTMHPLLESSWNFTMEALAWSKQYHEGRDGEGS